MTTTNKSNILLLCFYDRTMKSAELLLKEFLLHIFKSVRKSQVNSILSLVLEYKNIWLARPFNISALTIKSK